jgi:hypothetical protein
MRPLVDPDWLAEHHGEVNTVHVATTMAGGDPLAGFHDKRVAGAVTVGFSAARRTIRWRNSTGVGGLPVW